MNALTNRNIVNFIRDYGLATVLLILFIWIAVPRIYASVFPAALGTTMYNISGIEGGDTVSYNGDKYVVSEIYDFNDINDGIKINFTKTNNN